MRRTITLKGNAAYGTGENFSGQLGVDDTTPRSTLTEISYLVKLSNSTSTFYILNAPESP